MNLSKKNIIEISVALIIIVLVAIGGFLGYKYYLDQDDSIENPAEKEVASCEELQMQTPDNTPAPVAHVISSKLNKNADEESDICTWNVNDKLSHTSFPVGGKCIFGDQVFDKSGVYKVELLVEKNDCKLSKEVSVN